MLTESAKVLSFDDKGLWLEVESSSRRSTCSACSMKSGCGHALFSKLHANRSQSFKVNHGQFKVKTGDSVKLGIEGSKLVTLSFILYLLPLISMIATMSAAYLLGFNEFITILASLMGLVSGFFLLAFLTQRINLESLVVTTQEPPDNGITLQ